MLLDKGFSHENFTYEFIIKDDFIQPVNALNPDLKEVITNIVNPINDETLFFNFVSIDTNDNNSIINFCNKNGLLGIGGKLLLKNNVEINTYKEKVSDFISEINKMRAVLDMKNALDEGNFSAFKEKFLPFYEGNYKNENLLRFLKIMKFDLTSLDISSGYKLITILINNYLQYSVAPQLQFDLSNSSFLGSWESTSLISAMYFEIFLEFSQNSKIRKCCNTTCKGYFKIIGNDLRKIYCCNDCAKLQGKRNERKKKKEEGC